MRTLTLPSDELPGPTAPPLVVIREGDVLVRDRTAITYVMKVTAIGEKAALVKPLGWFFFRSEEGDVSQMHRPYSISSAKEQRLTSMAQWRHWADVYPGKEQPQ